MEPSVTEMTYYPGSPAISSPPRKRGYPIRGEGFGQSPGTIDINGERQRVKYWSPNFIVIARGDRDLLWNRNWLPVVVVGRVAGRHTAANDAAYVRAA